MYIVGKNKNWTLRHCYSHVNIKILQPNKEPWPMFIVTHVSAFLILTVVEI